MPGVAVPNTQTNFAASNLQIGGDGFIAGIAPGIVTVAGAPARRRVNLHDAITGRRLDSCVSAPDGTYRFNNLNPARRYYVTAFDHQLVFNAVIRDNITPAPMA